MGSSLRSRIAIWIGIAALVAGAAVLAASLVSVAVGALVLVAATVSGWIVGQLLAQRLTSALERLGAAATTLAAGDRSRRVAVEGPREVRIVADAFNRMADDVSSALDQLSSEESRKSQFVSDVSHELRTPLTAIRGAAETLLDGDVAEDDQERFLSTIATEAERLTRLANDLLTLQRIEGATGELPFRVVDLGDAAARAAAMLEPLLEDRAVTLHVSGVARPVLGEVDRLQQVIANLVDNASRMVGSGGNVWVELADDGSDSVLVVRDDGPGFAEAELASVFDRFYRADTSRTRASGGSGLGLAIVRAIVEAHGGTISARNLSVGGASLTVRLPALTDYTT